MINWNECSLINYYHNKLNGIVFKCYNNTKQTTFFAKESYPAFFFIKSKDLDITKKVLTDFKFQNDYSNMEYLITFEYETQDEWVKIIYDNIDKVYLYELQNKIRDKLDLNKIIHYELDLLPGDNYILDRNIAISTHYKTLFFDIETRDDSGGIEIGRDQILSICCIDSDGNEFIMCDDNEKFILEKFVSLVNQYDIVAGYNSNKFDWPYILARIKKHNILFYNKSIIHLDIMEIFMNSFATKTRIGKKFMTSYSLDNVCKSFLDTSKLKIEESDEGYGGRIWNLFNTNREKLIAYNLQDSRLLKLLDNEFKLIDNEVALCQLVSAPLTKTRSQIPMIDMLFIKEARKRGMHLLSKPRNVEKAHYEGGYVFDGKPGVYSNVQIRDFNSMYPSIFRTCNISPDTLLEHEEPGCIKLSTGVCFTQRFRGLIPSVLDGLTDLRLKYKAEQSKLKESGASADEILKMDFKQTSVKVLILSIYGTSGSAYFRGFSLPVAEGVTLTGQYLIKNIISELQKNKYTVVMADTDSCGFCVNTEQESQLADTIITDTINKSVKDLGVTGKNYLSMSHERTFSKFIVVAKKMYCGWVIAE